MIEFIGCVLGGCVGERTDATRKQHYDRHDHCHARILCPFDQCRLSPFIIHTVFSLILQFLLKKSFRTIYFNTILNSSSSSAILFSGLNPTFSYTCFPTVFSGFMYLPLWAHLLLHVFGQDRKSRELFCILLGSYQYIDQKNNICQNCCAAKYAAYNKIAPPYSRIIKNCSGIIQGM